MYWNPDPRWPHHIVEMAAVIARGEDARCALHDALLEEGLPESAKTVLNEPLGMIEYTQTKTRGLIVGRILNDGWPVESAEMDVYLNSRG